MSKNTSFHKLHPEVRADRRKLAFRKLDTGWNKYQVADLVEVHFKTVERWKKERKKFETNNGHGKKRGRQDDQRLLDDKKQKEIISIIKNSTPEKHNVSAYLWSRRAIAECIEKKYGIFLNLQRISHYAKIWGFSPQRPKKQATEQNKSKVKKWLNKTYPAIVRRAKEENAEIHWGDETGLNINTNYQRSYAQKRKTPILKIPSKKVSCSMISSITNQGKLRYMVYKGGMNVMLFKKFLQRLTKETDKKIFLILDNLKVHHAKIIQEWQKKNSEKIELFFPTALLPTRKSR